MLAPILAFGIPLLLAAAAFIYFRRTIDGPAYGIVVVDRRTAKLARQRITAAIDAGDLTRANAGLTALIVWLRDEIHTGPRRHRVRYARLLEQAELDKDGVMQRMGLGQPTNR